jgi:hypothetical protein
MFSEVAAGDPAFDAAQGLGMRIAGVAAFAVVRLAGAIVSDLGHGDAIQGDIWLPIPRGPALHRRPRASGAVADASPPRWPSSP